MASDQGLSIFDEPESGDDATTPSGSTARGTAAEKTQVLPVTPKDEPPAAADDAPADDRNISHFSFRLSDKKAAENMKKAKTS